MQLQQRCILSDYSEDLKPPPLFSTLEPRNERQQGTDEDSRPFPRSLGRCDGGLDAFPRYQWSGKVTEIMTSPRNSDDSWSSPSTYQSPTTTACTSIAPGMGSKAMSMSSTPRSSTAPVHPSQISIPNRASAERNVSDQGNSFRDSRSTTSESPSVERLQKTSLYNGEPAPSFYKLERLTDPHVHQSKSPTPPIPPRQRPPLSIPDPADHPALRPMVASQKSNSFQHYARRETFTVDRSRCAPVSPSTDPISSRPRACTSPDHGLWMDRPRAPSSEKCIELLDPPLRLTTLPKSICKNTESSVRGRPSSGREFLPSEANKFAGFCKGAWRLQVGDKKKALDERQRPGGIFNANRYWQCSKCKFEGRLTSTDGKRKDFDTRLFIAKGVQLRWGFLFKSHIELREANPNYLESNFGCVFCLVEGKGTLTFRGVQGFMAHLQEHRCRNRLPWDEVLLYRMNCKVGWEADQEGDFDLNIIARSD